MNYPLCLVQNRPALSVDDLTEWVPCDGGCSAPVLFDLDSDGYNEVIVPMHKPPRLHVVSSREDVPPVADLPLARSPAMFKGRKPINVAAGYTGKHEVRSTPSPPALVSV